MAFGLTRAPATFQKAINLFQYIEVYTGLATGSISSAWVVLVLLSLDCLTVQIVGIRASQCILYVMSFFHYKNDSMCCLIYYTSRH
jgi:hypothetical protein